MSASGTSSPRQSMKKLVNDSDVARTLVIGSPSYAVSALSRASNESRGGVPTRARPMPEAGSYAPSIENGRACPFQPCSGWSKSLWCCAATYM